MTWSWVLRTNKYLISDVWPAVRFQAILYLFLWASCIRLAVSDVEPPSFSEINSSQYFYAAWLTQGIVSPTLAAVAWFLIEKRSGRKRYIGMWFRVAADIGMLSVIMAFHIADVSEVVSGGRGAHIFERYGWASIIIFVVLLIIRDVWTLALTESTARKIRQSVNHE